MPEVPMNGVFYSGKPRPMRYILDLMNTDFVSFSAILHIFKLLLFLYCFQHIFNDLLEFFFRLCTDKRLADDISVFVHKE